MIFAENVRLSFVLGDQAVSIVSSGVSAIGKLAALAALLAVFLFGLAGVVYMSLQGAEIKVPEITGKGLHDSEKELALLGLKIKKRADRVSAEKPDTIIEQLPKPGETVKSGQMILVVTSKGGGEGDLPPSLKNTTDEEEAEKIEEMISDKPKKPKANSNTNRKKPDTAKDVNTDVSGASNSSTSSGSGDGNSNKKEPANTSNPGDKPNRNTQTPPRLPNPSTKQDPKPKSANRP